jgi:hypothetical protein
VDIASIKTRNGRVLVNHLPLTVIRRRPVPEFELALRPVRFTPKRFRPIRTSPFQLQVAHAAITHDKGMGFGTIIGRRRFSPRQQMNAAWDDGRFPFFPDP